MTVVRFLICVSILSEPTISFVVVGDCTRDFPPEIIGMRNGELLPLESNLIECVDESMIRRWSHQS
jgi:hypothetical protein